MTPYKNFITLLDMNPWPHVYIVDRKLIIEDGDSASKSYPQCGDCKGKAPITKL